MHGAKPDRSDQINSITRAIITKSRPKRTAASNGQSSILSRLPTDCFTMLISSTSLQLRILVHQLHSPLLVPTIRSRSLQHCSQCNFRSMQDPSHTGRLSSTGRVSGHFVRSFHQANKGSHSFKQTSNSIAARTEVWRANMGVCEHRNTLHLNLKCHPIWLPLFLNPQQCYQS